MILQFSSLYILSFKIYYIILIYAFKMKNYDFDPCTKCVIDVFDGLCVQTHTLNPT